MKSPKLRHLFAGALLAGGIAGMGYGLVQDKDHADRGVNAFILGGLATMGGAFAGLANLYHGLPPGRKPGPKCDIAP